jgi:hypothetical protein
MSDMTPVPVRIVEMVGEHVREQKRNLDKFDNTAPYDESAQYNVHALARRIYAEGWADGRQVAKAEERALRE